MTHGPYGSQAPGTPAPGDRPHHHGYAPVPTPLPVGGGPASGRDPRQDRRPGGRPWLPVVVVVLVLVLLGVGVAVGGAAVWVLDPWGWRGASSADGPAQSSSSSDAYARGGTGEYSFSYPASWTRSKDAEEPSEGQLYRLDVDDADGLNILTIMENEVLGPALDECREFAVDNGYEFQAEFDLDGRVGQHYQSTEPRKSGSPRVADIWCTEGDSRTLILVFGATFGDEATGRGVSAAHVVIDTWRWTA